MAKKQKGDEFPDPTIPDVSVEVDGETFRLCFDMAALRAAKAMLAASGIKLNVLHSINFQELDIDVLPELFFAAALRYQPTLTWEQALRLVNLRTLAGIFGGLFAAYKAAMLGPEENPPGAAEQT